MKAAPASVRRTMVGTDPECVTAAADDHKRRGKRRIREEKCCGDDPTLILHFLAESRIGQIRIFKAKNIILQQLTTKDD